MQGRYPYFDRNNGYDSAYTKDKVKDAVARGTITREETMDLEMTSMMTSGRSNDHRADAVVETRVRARPANVLKTLRRAEILRRVLGRIPVKCIVITTEPERHAAEMAEAQGVQIVTFNPREEFAPSGKVGTCARTPEGKRDLITAILHRPTGKPR